MSQNSAIKIGSGKILFRAEIEVDHHASKKNNWTIFRGKHGRPQIGKTAKIKNLESALLCELSKRRADYGITEPIKGRVFTVCLFRFPKSQFYTKRMTENMRNGDCSNLSQLIEDCLQKAGIIENDFWCAPIYIDRVVGDKMSVYIELSEC